MEPPVVDRYGTDAPVSEPTTDLEAPQPPTGHVQQITPGSPTIAQPIPIVPATQSHQQSQPPAEMPTRIVYVHDYRYPPAYYVEHDRADRDPRMCCAIFGFVFSWIPIIGLVTFLCNFDAPPSSLRGQLSYGACFIAAFVVLFNIIFWSVY